MNEIGSMPFKVTGYGKDGRFNFFRDDWHLVRMPPKFFALEVDALHYLNDLEMGILWKRNDEDEPRNKYSVALTLNTSWPEGARGKKVKHYKKEGSPIDEAMAKQDQ